MGGDGMTWLIWRQHRRAGLVMLLVLAALAALLIPTGLQMRHAVEGFSDCVAKIGHGRLAAPQALDGCHELSNGFVHRYSPMSYVAILLLFAPVLVGMFWGAPLVAREVEQGTHRFTWTQGVSRRRWALTKVALLGGFVVLAAVVYALLINWWIQPFTIGNGSRLSSGLFDSQGVVPVAYTLFAVALGVFAGSYWRKVLPAMGVTLVGFVVARLAVLVLARPHFSTPKTLKIPVVGLDVFNDFNGDMVLSRALRAADGRTLMTDAYVSCGAGPAGPPAGGGGGDPVATVCSSPGAYNWLSYQPADRFWPFQYLESGIFVVLAAALLLLAFRKVRQIS
jgi:ABC-type transport system involved in multi-copper enzyme maturation permease subunit